MNMEVPIRISEKLFNKLALISENKGCDISELIEESILNTYNISIVDLNSIEFDNDVELLKLNNNIIRPYYVYVYLNPLISGKFEYGDYKFEYQPIYVGKGVDDRYNSHLDGNSHNEDVNYFVEWLRDRNQKPIIEIIATGLSSLNAHKLEGSLIKEIGRRDLKQGMLLNKTGGVTEVSDYSNSTFDDFKIHHIISVLNKSTNMAHAAELLKISERTLYRIKKRYSITKVNGNWVI